MRAGWLGFLRQKARRSDHDPDIAVTGRKLWYMGGVIVVSSAALLGTSDDSPPPRYAHYEFRRDGIDGGSVELTADQPSATFFVNVTATDLGPEDVVSTTEAQAFLDGTVEAEGLSEEQAPPPVEVKITTTQGQIGFFQPITQTFSPRVALPFTGNCGDPHTGVKCSAHFSIEVRRVDDGEAGGKLTIAWSFTLSSLGEVRRIGAEEDVQVGPVDPPWTVEVTEP